MLQIYPSCLPVLQKWGIRFANSFLTIPSRNASSSLSAAQNIPRHPIPEVPRNHGPLACAPIVVGIETRMRTAEARFKLLTEELNILTEEKKKREREEANGEEFNRILPLPQHLTWKD
jgi:hypothetical protein